MIDEVTPAIAICFILIWWITLFAVAAVGVTAQGAGTVRPAPSPARRTGPRARPQADLDHDRFDRDLRDLRVSLHQAGWTLDDLSSWMGSSRPEVKENEQGQSPAPRSS